jgi:hypothetical protein
LFDFGLMKRVFICCSGAVLGLLITSSAFSKPSQVDKLLAADNAKAKAGPTKAAQKIGDLEFLRKTSIDLIGRIPTYEEIQQYQKWPASQRRTKLIDRLMADPRFADRWTVYFADMLRIRSAATGGNALLAYLHKAIDENRPWDDLAREMIAANGSTGKTPAVGFILGESAEPMALAAATAQMFLGVRMFCAQCHNHPFDVWKQKQFYELATFYGKTRLVENEFARRTYTTETKDTSVLWPPERRKPKTRAAVMPKFPFELDEYEIKPDFIKRLEALRAHRQLAAVKGSKAASLDSLLDDADTSKAFDKGGKFTRKVSSEAKNSARALDVEGDLYRQSEQRTKLSQLITSPYNPYFARNMVNRLWGELMGHGFYEPYDDFQDIVSHPKTLKHLSHEFIASGYDLKKLIRTIVETDAYSKGHLDTTVSNSEIDKAQRAFTAATSRRMVSEVMYDSVVIAGHLTEYKWPAGANVRTYTERVRVVLPPEKGDGQPAPPKPTPLPVAGTEPKMAPSMLATRAGQGYNLEETIALDFDALLKGEMAKDLEMMKKVSDAELERKKKMAEMAEQRRQDIRVRYKYETVERKSDDNPRFGSTMRMATPAPPAHFLRVFGQTPREVLGEFRDHTPSMRQQLMMLNGKITHEASRVGTLEPMHRHIGEGKQDIVAAIKLAYIEILTRQPDAEEIEFASEIVGTGKQALEGMADLRWTLLNSNDFRYLP